MRPRFLTSCCVLLAVLADAGCNDTLLNLPAWPKFSRPRGVKAPISVLALAGHGDMLAAGLDGGVVLWDLSSGATRRVTRIDGLPSDHVEALALDERAEGLLAATRSGLAQGWWEGAWASALAGGEGCDREFSACTDRPGGGWVAGSARGLLAAWTGSQLDTLRLPRRTRIVGLTHASRVLDPSAPLLDAPEPDAIAPGLSPGLVVATETEGLWVLRPSGARVAWLQLDVRDGLPKGRRWAMTSDTLGRAWVATDTGLACVGPGIAIHAWPADSLLGRPARALLRAPDGCIYAALADGVLRVDARTEAASAAPPVERVPGIGGPVLALAWADGNLWWTDGIRVHSQSGLLLEPPGTIPMTICPIWIGQNLHDLFDRGVPAPPSREGAPSCSGPVRPRSTTLVARAGTLPLPGGRLNREPRRYRRPRTRGLPG